MSTIIGHESIISFFEKVIENGALHHAYCFVGREHVGRKTLALYLAEKILEIEVARLSVHPDLTIVTQEKNPKTGKTKKFIDVDQIRGLKNALSRHSAMGGYKVGIIDGAEKMNTNSSNALLKTLEEPGGQTALFLITTDEALLLPTIRSRCHMIYLSPVNKNKITTALEKTEMSHAEADDMAALAQGLPGLALKWSEKPELYEEYKKTGEQFFSLFGMSYHAKLALVNPLFGDKTDHIQTREKLLKTLGIWQVLMHDVLQKQVGLPTDEKIPVIKKTQLLRIFTEIEHAKKYIQKNINPRLLVEHILLQIP
jgi:hypothetical protein